MHSGLGKIQPQTLLGRDRFDCWRFWSNHKATVKYYTLKKKEKTVSPAENFGHIQVIKGERVLLRNSTLKFLPTGKRTIKRTNEIRQVKCTGVPRAAFTCGARWLHNAVSKGRKHLHAKELHTSSAQHLTADSARESPRQRATTAQTQRQMGDAASTCGRKAPQASPQPCGCYVGSITTSST